MQMYNSHKATRQTCPRANTDAMFEQSFSCIFPPSRCVYVRRNKQISVCKTFVAILFVCVNDDDYKIMVVFALNI